MSMSEYIGERYVPQFADPQEWSIETAYDPLTIVKSETQTGDNALYVSKTYVPAGTSVWNEKFWAMWSGPAVQGEQGPQGPQGEPGPAGTDATNALYVRAGNPFYAWLSFSEDDPTFIYKNLWAYTDKVPASMKNVFKQQARLMVLLRYQRDFTALPTDYLICNAPLSASLMTSNLTPINVRVDHLDIKEYQPESITISKIYVEFDVNPMNEGLHAITRIKNMSAAVSMSLSRQLKEQEGIDIFAWIEYLDLEHYSFD